MTISILPFRLIGPRLGLFFLAATSRSAQNLSVDSSGRHPVPLNNYVSTGNNHWLAPESGTAALGSEVSGQNDQSSRQFHDTVSMRQTKRVEFNGFFAVNRSLPRQELDCGTSQGAEHKIAHGFGCAPDADKQGSEVVFKLGVDPFRSDALFKALSNDRFHRYILTTSKIAIDNGDMGRL